MQDEQLRQRLRKRIIVATCLTPVLIIPLALLQAARRGAHLTPLAVLILIAITVPVMAATLWLYLRFADRLGLYDPASYREAQRRPDETRLSQFRRNLTAPPRRRPIYRLFLVLGVMELFAAATGLLAHRRDGVWLLACAAGMFLVAGVESLPRGPNGLVAALRILVMLACFGAATGLMISAFR